jgi:chromosome segregation ATPase
MTDDILARIPDVVKRLRANSETAFATSIRGEAADALEAAQARIAELEAERDTARTILKASGDRVRELEAERDKFRYALTQAANDTRSVRDRFFAERKRAERAEAEAHHWKLAEGAERDLRLRADQRIRQLEAERC